MAYGEGAVAAGRAGLRGEPAVKGEVAWRKGKRMTIDGMGKTNLLTTTQHIMISLRNEIATMGITGFLWVYCVDQGSHAGFRDLLGFGSGFHGASLG